MNSQKSSFGARGYGFATLFVNSNHLSVWELTATATGDEGERRFLANCCPELFFLAFLFGGIMALAAALLMMFWMPRVMRTGFQ